MHFQSVKFLARKSGCVNFLTNLKSGGGCPVRDFSLLANCAQYLEMMTCQDEKILAMIGQKYIVSLWPGGLIQGMLQAHLWYSRTALAILSSLQSISSFLFCPRGLSLQTIYGRFSFCTNSEEDKPLNLKFQPVGWLLPFLHLFEAHTTCENAIANMIVH